MKDWMIELNFKQDVKQSFNDLFAIIFSFMFVLSLFGIIVLFATALKSCTSSNININEEQWGGYYPYKIYTVFDKETGVYYAITGQGGITPMYTIEGEVKLVDQGNEYVVHKNLGEPDAQE